MTSASASFCRTANRFVRLLLAFGATFCSVNVHALPSLTPHEHGAGKVWDGSVDGTRNHNHLFERSVTHSDVNGFRYDADAVWDNRTYRFNRDALIVESIELPVYAHGFIEETQKPRYLFKDGDKAAKTFDQPKKDLIGRAVQMLVDTAKAQSKGKTTPDGTALVTGIGLEETKGAAFEFRIGFFDNLFEGNRTLAEWMLIPRQAWSEGGSPTRNEIRATPILAFDDDIKWLFDTTKNPAACAADLTPTQKTEQCEFDFLTVALHELGHVFGLGHTPNPTPGMGPAEHLMRADLAFQDAINGKTFRRVDDSTARGLAGLYTQPVPEAGTLWLVLGGVMALAVLRRNRRLTSKSASG